MSAGLYNCHIRQVWPYSRLQIILSRSIRQSESSHERFAVLARLHWHALNSNISAWYCYQGSQRQSTDNDSRLPIFSFSETRRANNRQILFLIVLLTCCAASIGPNRSLNLPSFIQYSASVLRLSNSSRRDESSTNDDLKLIGESDSPALDHICKHA